MYQKIFFYIAILLLSFSCSKKEEIATTYSEEEAYQVYQEALESLDNGDIYLASKKFSDKHKVIIKPIDLKYSHKINFDLIINATSASITSNDSPVTADTFNFLNIKGACYDMMYGIETPFMRCAFKKTDAVYNGLGMLIEQAAVSFNIWHQVKPTTIKVGELLKSL